MNGRHRYPCPKDGCSLGKGHLRPHTPTAAEFRAQLRTRLAAVLEANAGRCLDDDGDRAAVLAALLEAV